MEDNKLKEYIKKHGSYYNIKNIDKFRSRNVNIIQTNIGEMYYIDECGGVFTSEDLHVDSEITDTLFKEMLLDRLNKYLKRQEYLIKLSEKTINSINKKI